MFNFNTQELLPIVGYTLIGIFLILGAVIVVGLMRDRDKTKPDKEVPEKKVKPSKVKGATKTDKKNLEKENQDGMFTSGKKKSHNEPASGFALGSASKTATDIEDSLSSLNGARSVNRFRASSADDLIKPEPSTPTKPEKPFRAFASTPVEPESATPEKGPVQQPPVAAPAPRTIPAAPAPLASFTPPKGLPTVPTRPNIPAVPNKLGTPPPPPAVKSNPADPTKQIFVGKTHEDEK